MTPTIVLLNGTSSSGKTSILRSLQDQSPEPFLDMGIDRFIFVLPKRYLDRPLWDDVLGKAVQSGRTGTVLFSGMHHAIAAATRQGNNVIHRYTRYDLEVDTSVLSAGQCAQKIMDRLKSPPQAFRQLAGSRSSDGEVTPADIIAKPCFKKNNSSSKTRSKRIARRTIFRLPS